MKLGIYGTMTPTKDKYIISSRGSMSRGGLCPGEVYVQRLSLCPQGVLCPYTYPGGSPVRSVGSPGCRCRGRSSGSCAAWVVLLRETSDGQCSAHPPPGGETRENIQWILQSPAPSWSSLFSCSFRQHFCQRRMHSSKMHTDRCSGCHYMSVQGGSLCPGWRPSPVNRITDRCFKHFFSFSLQSVI